MIQQVILTSAACFWIAVLVLIVHFALPVIPITGHARAKRTAAASTLIISWLLIGILFYGTLG